MSATGGVNVHSGAWYEQNGYGKAARLERMAKPIQAKATRMRTSESFTVFALQRVQGIGLFGTT